jgi:hypothetical protein
MTQFSDPGPVPVKPQSNVYTVLVAIAVIALVVALVIVLNALLTPVDRGGYGLELGQLFDPQKLPEEIRPPKQ